MSHSARRATVREILENASAYAWTLDCLGVLRLSLSDTFPFSKEEAPDDSTQTLF